MGYTFVCDGPCGEGYHTFPPFAGEFTEQFLKTRGGKFAIDFKPGEKVTVCANCLDLMLLAGQIAVCRRCGAAWEPDGPNDHDPECHNCGKDGELVLKDRRTEGELA